MDFLIGDLGRGFTEHHPCERVKLRVKDRFAVLSVGGCRRIIHLCTIEPRADVDGIFEALGQDIAVVGGLPQMVAQHANARIRGAPLSPPRTSIRGNPGGWMALILWQVRQLLRGLLGKLFAFIEGLAASHNLRIGVGDMSDCKSLFIPSLFQSSSA